MVDFETYNEDVEFLKRNAEFIKKEFGKGELNRRIKELFRRKIQLKKQEFIKFQNIIKDEPYSFPEFCKKYLKIKPKTGGLVSFELNEDQRIWFDFLLNNYEKNQKEYVNFVTVKYRQNGITTVSNAFVLFKMIANNFNVAFTGANGKNTRNLYTIFNRFFENSPLQEFKFKNTSKHKGLQFNINDNEAHFLTSEGSDTTSLTIQGLFEDELGERVDISDFEALAKVAGGFHLLVGTPKGTANRLYLSTVELEKTNDVLFLAWHLFKTNELNFDKNYRPSKEILEYLKKYDLEHIEQKKIAWIDSKLSRIKLSSFDPLSKLVQNYPANLKSGFENTAANCFCNPYFINHAFENKKDIETDSCILGIDVAGNGVNSDSFVMAIRLGNYATFKELKVSPDDHSAFYSRSIQIADFLKKNNHLKVKTINVDGGGTGTEFLKILQNVLREAYIDIKVNAVFFGNRIEVIYGDFEKRKIGVKEHIYFELRKWLSTARVYIENVGKIKEELFATQVVTRDGEEFLLTKEEVRKNLGHSPDFADALALTFMEKRDLSFQAEFKLAGT